MKGYFVRSADGAVESVHVGGRLATKSRRGDQWGCLTSQRPARRADRRARRPGGGAGRAPRRRRHRRRRRGRQPADRRRGDARHPLPDRVAGQDVDGDGADAARRRGTRRPRRPGAHVPARTFAVADPRGVRAPSRCATCCRTRAASMATTSPTSAAATTASNATSSRAPPLGQTHPLGATMSYCNTGFSILGRVIEVVTGKVWDAAMRERLFDAARPDADEHASRGGAPPPGGRRARQAVAGRRAWRSPRSGCCRGRADRWG